MMAITPMAFCAASTTPQDTETAVISTSTTEITPMETDSSLLAPGADIGMWVWREEQLVDPAEREHLIQFCQKYGISRIFVQVRFEESETGYQLATPEDWNALLSAATKAGVKVDALDGAGDMGFASNRHDTLQRLEAVLAFQKQQPTDAKFSGVHYDIEPYVTQRWKNEDKQVISTELLDTMVEIKKAVRDAAPSMTIAHDIPFWYSGRDEYLIKYDDSEKYLNEHIQDQSDFLGIMSYRTHMTGRNSTSVIANEELEYAGETGKNVFLSLETVTLKETPSITFQGREPVDFVQAIRELNVHLEGTPGYGGIFLHTYRTVRPMLEQWDETRIDLACSIEPKTSPDDGSEQVK